MVAHTKAPFSKFRSEKRLPLLLFLARVSYFDGKS
jgi:hypothetical protein